ncbi:hypothetical protein [Longimicrobium sp.]|uniref:hypothetical protein n=1 Tax=Longimicrobium sp. TaxID=2029185 RepID=UPI002E30AD7E|nr:hypothetical protein [Longimicrobium sp.]HEX6036506.1 hypothetical protein [Longimicrobium sp.]
MNTLRRLNVSAALVVLGGSVYLATPARAEAVMSCPDQEWYAAAARAKEFCGGPASFAGYCDSGGQFVITQVYCTSPY